MADRARATTISSHSARWPSAGAGDLLRPARLREFRPAGQAVTLEGAAVHRGGRRRPRSPASGPSALARPVLGRDARDGVRADATGRRGLAHHCLVAGQHDPVGGRGEPPAREFARRRAGNAAAPRGRRNDRLQRVSVGDDGLLPPARHPHGPDAGTRRPHLRQAGAQSEGVPNDERPERIPCRRQPERLGHRCPAAGDPD